MAITPVRPSSALEDSTSWARHVLVASSHTLPMVSALAVVTLTASFVPVVPVLHVYRSITPVVLPV